MTCRLSDGTGAGPAAATIGRGVVAQARRNRDGKRRFGTRRRCRKPPDRLRKL